MTASPPPPHTAPKGKPKSARRRSRELVLQGLYQWLLNRDMIDNVASHIREQADFPKCDAAHFDLLLRGCSQGATELDAQLTPHIDRPLAELSPIEHGSLYIGAYELMHCHDIPYRVAINEAVELCKTFGGTDGHKYVNGVLDKIAGTLRPHEVNAHRNPQIN